MRGRRVIGERGRRKAPSTSHHAPAPYDWVRGYLTMKAGERVLRLFGIQKNRQPQPDQKTFNPANPNPPLHRKAQCNPTVGVGGVADAGRGPCVDPNPKTHLLSHRPRPTP